MTRTAILTPLVLVPVALLAACKQQPSVELKNASAAQVAEKIKAAGGQIKMEPGLYKTTMKIESMDIPGLKDPRALEAIKQAQTRVNAMSRENCLTPEQAAKPDARLFTAQSAPGCTFGHFSMQGGKVSYDMTCKPPQGQGSMTATADGTMNSTGFDMAVDTRMNNPGIPGGVMTTKARVTSQRTGACKA